MSRDFIHYIKNMRDSLEGMIASLIYYWNSFTLILQFFWKSTMKGLIFWLKSNGDLMAPWCFFHTWWFDMQVIIYAQRRWECVFINLTYPYKWTGRSNNLIFNKMITNFFFSKSIKFENERYVFISCILSSTIK